jgi:hypothetical protein
MTSSYRDAIARANLAAFTAHTEATNDGDEVGEAIETTGIVKTVSQAGCVCVCVRACARSVCVCVCVCVCV